MHDSIKRRTLLTLAGTAGLGALAGCGGNNDAQSSPSSEMPSATVGSAKRYNVLLIVVDQERFGRWMPSELRLAARERLLSKGVSFTRHYADAIPCTPSRSVLYTGLHAPRAGMRGNVGMGGQQSLSTGIHTIGSMLKGHGYDRTYFGKWHLSEIEGGDECASAGTLIPYGFDEYNPCGDIPGTWWSGYQDDPGIGTRAKEWLNQRSASANTNPFLLAVNFVNPHDIMYYYPEPGRERDGRGGRGDSSVSFGFAEPRGAALYEKRWDVALPPHARASLSGKPAAQIDYRAMYDAFQSYPDTAEGDELLKRYVNYYVNCQVDVDAHLDAVLTGLASSRFADDTVVVFTSDHGEMGTAHGLRGKGPFVYEENNNVPLVIVHPEVTTASSRGTLTCHLDIVPTLLSFAGVARGEVTERYPNLRGRDLSAAVYDASAPTRSSVLFTYDMTSMIDSDSFGDSSNEGTRGLVRGICDGRYKFARYFRSDDYHTPASFEELVERNDLELYDLSEDPQENVNLATDLVVNRSLIEAQRLALNELVVSEMGSDSQPS